MKSSTEILTAVYDPGFWRVIDEWGDFCVFCGASDGRDQFEPGVIHHYGSCLLREIRAHLMCQIAMPRRFREAAIEQLAALRAIKAEADLSYPDYGSGGLSPTAAEAEAMPAAEVVPEHVVYRTARAEPEVVPVVQPERLHSWQSMKNGKAARCVNCGLAALNGAPALNDVCPGRNPDLPAPAEVKAVQPAVPLVQVMCPRCHVTEVVPASGGALPDLPQITPGGPFMVVSWMDPAHGRQTGVYCKLCWSDTTASFITASLQPAILCRPTPVSGPGPGQLA